MTCASWLSAQHVLPDAFPQHKQLPAAAHLLLHTCPRCRSACVSSLQVHAGNRQYEAALESAFNAPQDSNSSSSSQDAGGAAGLSAQMEVADAVLRLVADNAATPSIRCGAAHACCPHFEFMLTGFDSNAPNARVPLP